VKIWHFNARPGLKFIGFAVLIAILMPVGGPLKTVAETKTESTAEKKITIAADQLVVDREANTAEFAGNVNVTRTDGHLTADRLVVYYRNAARETPKENRSGDLNSGIDKMVAEGHVRIETPQIVAEAEKAVYRQSDRTIVLSGANARVSSGNNSVAGSSITLYIDKESISVVGDAHQRVEAILTPGQQN
jgi:lipopolysaccharide export system protein LptA